MADISRTRQLTPKKKPLSSNLHPWPASSYAHSPTQIFCLQELINQWEAHVSFHKHISNICGSKSMLIPKLLSCSSWYGNKILNHWQDTTSVQKKWTSLQKQRLFVVTSQCCNIQGFPPVFVVCFSYLFVGDEDRSAEDDPFYHLTAGRSGQRAGITIVTSQRWRQQILQHKRLQDRLFFYMREVKDKVLKSIQHDIHNPLYSSTNYRDQALWSRSKCSCFTAFRFVLLISFALCLPCSMPPYWQT